MQILCPRNDGQPIQLAIGILIGVLMANLGLLTSVLILAGLVVVAHGRGYRITLTKDNAPYDQH